MTSLPRGCKNYLYTHPEASDILQYMYTLPPQEELTTSDILINMGISIDNIRHYQNITKRLREFGLLSSRYVNSTRSCNRIRLYRISEYLSNDIEELLTEIERGGTKT